MSRLSTRTSLLRSRFACGIAAALTLFVSASSALAHHEPYGYEDVDEFDQAQMTSGFLHPFTGLDHLLLALAIGGIAYGMSRRSGLGTAASFVASMGLGMAAGRFGFALPLLEHGLALSVIGAGLVMAFASRNLRFSGLTLAILAGFWHGNAHGSEMSASASVLAYGSALLLGTASLSAIGWGFMVLCPRQEAASSKWIGAALAVAGAWVWIA